MIELKIGKLYGIQKGSDVKLNIAASTVYRPFAGNDVKLNLKNPIPTDLSFNLGGDPGDGGGDPGDGGTGAFSRYEVSTWGTRYEKSDSPIHTSNKSISGIGLPLNTDTLILKGEGVDYLHNATSINYSTTVSLYSNTDVSSKSSIDPLQFSTNVTLMVYDGLRYVYVDYNVNGKIAYDNVHSLSIVRWASSKRNDLLFLAKWNNDFENIHYLVTFSVGAKADSLDYVQTIRWGYSLNQFIVGGVTTIPNNPEDGVVIPPDDEVIEHINYEVYRVVNSVIIKETTTGSTVNFDSFTISHDIESFAWTVQFDVLDKDSFELIRPVGRTLKVVDIQVNDETFTLVVAKGSIQRRQGKVVYRCSGWSRTKLLADPYAAKRSYKDTQARTAAQIVNMELTGTGFDYTWSTVDWQIPVGIHSYQDKTPLGAIIAVAESVGAVVVPHPTLAQFDIRPYYPVSPWQWDSAGLNRSMNELQFFEISNDPVPKPNPDGVYVYGEDNNGVGVKAVRNGKPGTALLPDVVNKYITANVAGQERGRVEVSKNCFIDRYTMTTYVDENGIIKPHELVRFTDTDGGTWRGMVLSVKVDCNRVGTALIQTIQVARFYDD
tara:strand:- start:4668 stop:6479 length:1812 start_codon:yes stop_codon:yes gene_type:complete